MSEARPDQLAGGARVGLLVGWPRNADATMDDLAARFTVREATEVVWAPALAETNYMRLTGRRPSDSARESMNAQPALVVLIAEGDRDGSATSHGSSRADQGYSLEHAAADMSVNSTTAYLSTGHSNAKADYMLLLERDLDRMEPGHEWSGRVDRLERELAGTGGWRDVRHMFSVLGAGPPYAVLRNYEGLTDLSSLEDHGDIDLLVSDYPAAIRLLDATSRLRSVPRWGGRFDVKIGSAKVICDIRFPGDGYYDADWMGRMLDTRELHSDGFYVLEATEYLESLLYHAIVHKPRLSTEYRLRLRSMAAASARPEFHTGLESDSTARELLVSVLEHRGFRITRPRDPTVYFNHTVREVAFPGVMRVRDALERRVYRFGLRHVIPVGRRLGSKTTAPSGDRQD